MTSKQKSKLKKEFMPKYYRTFGTVGIALLTCALVGFIVCVACFMAFDSDAANPFYAILLIAYLVVMLVLCIVYIIIASKYQKKIILQRTQEIESEFVDLPFEEATATLIERQVIKDYGFIANVGGYAGVLVVPFDEANVSVYSANVYTKVCTAIVITNREGVVIAEHMVDNVLFNFICKKGVRMNFVGLSKYLVSDKKEFVRVHIKGSGQKRTMTFLFGVVGSLISDDKEAVNISRQKILNILSKEMQ